MKASPPAIFLAIGTALAGAGLLGVALAGFLFRPLSPWKRALLGVGAFGLLLPVGLGQGIGWISDLVGIGLVTPILAFEWLQQRRRA